MESQAAIISIGSINADFQVRAERWLEAGHDIVATDFMRCGGGKAANVAYAARKLDAPVILIGHVGDDDLAEQALSPLLELDLRHVSPVRGAATGFVTVVVTPDGRKTMIAAHNANDLWTDEEAARATAVAEQAGAGSILVADCAAAIDPIARAMRAARRRNFTTVFDPSPVERVPGRLLPLVDLATPNPVEAERLTGIAVRSVEEAVRAGRALIARGVKTALMKMPDGGCVIVAEGSAVEIPAAGVRAVDTTGAGDCFAGALAAALLEHRSLEQAVVFAVAATHVSVIRYGAQASYPDRREVEEMLARLPPPRPFTPSEGRAPHGRAQG
jgi:ribokinase